jgi:hypothetical protein
MNVVFSLLMATMLIAAMILLRTLVNRQALQARLRESHAGSDCEQTGCLHACDRGDRFAPDDEPVARQNT